MSSFNIVRRQVSDTGDRIRQRAGDVALNATIRGIETSFGYFHPVSLLNRIANLVLGHQRIRPPHRLPVLRSDIAIVQIAVQSQSCVGSGSALRPLDIADVHNVANGPRGGLSAANTTDVINVLLVADEFGSLWLDIGEALDLVDRIERTGGSPYRFEFVGARARAFYVQIRQVVL